MWRWYTIAIGITKTSDAVKAPSSSLSKHRSASKGECVCYFHRHHKTQAAPILKVPILRRPSCGSTYSVVSVPARL